MLKTAFIFPPFVAAAIRLPYSGFNFARAVSLPPYYDSNLTLHADVDAPFKQAFALQYRNRFSEQRRRDSRKKKRAFAARPLAEQKGALETNEIKLVFV